MCVYADGTCEECADDGTVVLMTPTVMGCVMKTKSKVALTKLRATTTRQ